MTNFCIVCITGKIHLDNKIFYNVIHFHFSTITDQFVGSDTSTYISTKQSPMSDDSHTRSLLESYPEYVETLLQTVPSMPELVKEFVEQSVKRYNKDSVFWAPEAAKSKRCDFKNECHTVMTKYAENVFNEDVNRYMSTTDNCSKSFAERQVMESFGQTYPWHIEYVNFCNKYM